MKFIRSSKCTIKFATKHKQQQLHHILSEYGRICNFFIRHFWNNEVPSKTKLLKPIVDLPLAEENPTWLSARLRKVAAREAIDMIQAVKQRWKHKPHKAKMPKHRGQRMFVSSTIANLQPAKHTSFDAWLHIASAGNKIILDIPIKYHKHFNKWNAEGNRLNAYIITPKYVQFCFQVEAKPKKTEGKQIGIDTGIKALASTSEGKQYGKDIEQYINAVNRCKHGSKGQKCRRRALRQRIDEVAKEIMAEQPQLIVVEKLKGLNYKTKQNRRLHKSMRRSIGSWNYRYWLNRLQMATEENRISFRTVNPAYTSQQCSTCGHTNRRNRNGEVFWCLKCDHSGNADVNAASVILQRFLQGPYGALCKPKTDIKNVQV